MKNTFWAVPYRGHSIMGHFDCNVEVIEWLNVDTHVATKCLTVRAAQLAIAKYVKSKILEAV